MNKSAYMLFCAMEVEFRHYIRLSNVSQFVDWLKDKVVASNSDEDTVLRMLVELWTTVRGFSFASAWVELYKRNNKENMQRSKAFRKNRH